MKPKQMRTARAVIFHASGKLLMMGRQKNGEHYFVLPGGHLEDLETPEWAVVREVKEETGLDITVAKLLYAGTDPLGNHVSIYLCNYQGGEPMLPEDSIEAEVDAKTGQLHHPAWFAPEELLGQTVYPTGLLQQLEVDVAANFADNPKEITNIWNVQTI